MEDFDTHTSEYLMWWAELRLEAAREDYEDAREQLRGAAELHFEVFMRKVIAEGMSLSFEGKQQ